MKIYTIKKEVIFSSEQIILFGLLYDLPTESYFNYNHKGESRFKGLIDFCKKNIIYVNKIEDSDIAVLPYKFKDLNDYNFIKLSKKCKFHNKKLLCFYIDDIDKQYKLEDHVYLFRTSFYRNTKNIQENAICTFSPDYFDNKYLENNELSIGYCGHIMHGRKKYLSNLLRSGIKTNFILRKGFWAKGVPKDVARIEYFKNIEDNLFIFCYRGAGNFSYRFYETLMMGRIPILINTDCVFPWEDLYNIDDFGLIIDEKDILSGKKNLENEINNYYKKNKDKLILIQKNNRLMWEKYLSPCGFLHHLIHHFK